jgi:hypothetical protein
VIKQFNFYDIYGYLLPGMLLTGLLWLPLGLLTKFWPDQDLSKALFLAGLAYLLGHLIQTIAANVVPSKIRVSRDSRRAPSDLMLDQNPTLLSPEFRLSKAFKARLADQLEKVLGVSINVVADGNGDDDISKDRTAAFFQARSFLIAKKAANYVEQFEGLYSMMRGLSCALCVGAAYLCGWGLSFHRSQPWLANSMKIGFPLVVGSTLIFSRAGKSGKEWRRICLSAFLLLAFLGAGYWLGASRSGTFWPQVPPYSEEALWFCAAASLFAAARFFKSYREFANNFAITVWRDFSAIVSYGAIAQAGHANDPADGFTAD